MVDYVYKDNESTMPTLSAQLTSRMGDGSGNHEAAYLNAIELLVAALSFGSMIDIGCGRGRIAEAAAGKIRELVALEPDPGRCAWARAALEKHDSVTVHQLVTHEYIAQNPGKQFDLVILGMVLQHLSTQNCARVMSDITTLTKAGGIVVVSTTHALESTKCFTYQHVSSARITEEEFNAYADNPHEQDKGLPVHRFSRAEFEALVPPPFEIVQWNQFSYYRPEFLPAFATVHGTDPETLRDVGNSQFMVLKKKS